ncbi:MAG: hypothetical protein KKC71_07585 [Chloroflexi bacterium]|nr:hypothetical protein [Chloroflexota bacterium]
MFKISVLFKKFALAQAALALAVSAGLAALPTANVYAAGLGDETNPPAAPAAHATRLEKIWEREQTIYDRQGERLDRADTVAGRVQTIIDKLSAKGYDTSEVQAALNAFEDAIQQARPIHESASGIIASHPGFDASGKVTDPAQAVETVKELGAKLKEFRSTLGDPFKHLRDLLKALRDTRRQQPPAEAAPAPAG